MEAATLAWEPLGWRAAFVSEIDKAPCDLLEQRIDAPNYGDMTKFEGWPDHAIDLLVGGTPCQSFSVAGLRKGLADPRGSLMLTYGAIAKRYRPRWLVWENVPGVLSDDGGRSFGTFLGMLGELGYGFAYRVLDAQYFGLAQRRARVFVVGYLGDWRPPAAVLFESESLRGDPAPRREAGQGFAADVAPSLTSSAWGVDRAGESRGQDPVVAHSLRADGFDASEDGTGRGTPLVAHALNAKGGAGRSDGESETFVAVQCNGSNVGTDLPSLRVGNQHVTGGAPMIAFSCKDHGADAGDLAPTLRAMGHDGSHANAGGQLAVAHPFTLAIRGRGDSHELEYRQDGVANAVLTPNGGRGGIGVGAVAVGGLRRGGKPGGGDMPTLSDIAPTLERHHHGQSGVLTAWAVRRLTPKECERLQGAPDDWTNITRKGKPIADGPRYKMLGNSMAVPVMRWIGERIDLVRAHIPEKINSRGALESYERTQGGTKCKT